MMVFPRAVLSVVCACLRDDFVSQQGAVPKGSVSMCNICQGSTEKNKIGETEELVKCGECGRHGMSAQQNIHK